MIASRSKEAKVGKDGEGISEAAVEQITGEIISAIEKGNSKGAGKALMNLFKFLKNQGD